MTGCKSVGFSSILGSASYGVFSSGSTQVAMFAVLFSSLHLVWRLGNKRKHEHFAECSSDISTICSCSTWRYLINPRFFFLVSDSSLILVSHTLVRGWFVRTLSTSPPSLVRSCHGAYCGHSSASRKGSGTLQTYQKAAWKAYTVTRSLLFAGCLLNFEWILEVMFPNFPCGWKKISEPKTIQMDKSV